MNQLMQTQNQELVIREENDLIEGLLLKLFSFFVMLVLYEGRFLRRLNKHIHFISKSIF